MTKEKFKHTCIKCKKKTTNYFVVPENSWRKVVPKRYHKELLCWSCYSNFRKEKDLPKLRYNDLRLRKELRVIYLSKNKVTLGREILKPVFNFSERIR